MSVEGMIVALVLTAAALAWVVAPLLRGSKTRLDDALAAKQHERLLVYYERVLTNIRDLDEDSATGKMDEAEYQTERELWVQRGIQVLKALDGLAGEQTAGLPQPGADDAAVDRAIDEAIETAVQSVRTKVKSAAEGSKHSG